MRITVSFLLLGAALAACGGDGGGLTLPDARPVEPGCDGSTCSTSCNPVAPAGQQGCDAGKRCVWEIVQDQPDRIGRLACIPEGTAGLGDECTLSAVGAPDSCTAGLICIDGACRDVCGFDGAADAACETGFTCTRYIGTFSNGDDEPVAGVCKPACDPLAQLTPGGGTCGPNEGCYLLITQTGTSAVCAAAGTLGHGDDITGPPFANTCVPGARPRIRDDQAGLFECGGLCRPADVTSTTNLASEGGVGAESCQTRWGTPPPADGVGGESCRYLFGAEFGLTAFSNTVGWCFRHATAQYDSDDDQEDDAPFPRCSTLTTGDVVPPIDDPPHNDAIFFWCMQQQKKLEGTPARSSLAPVVPHLDRLSL